MCGILSPTVTFQSNGLVILVALKHLFHQSFLSYCDGYEAQWIVQAAQIIQPLFYIDFKSNLGMFGTPFDDYTECF